MDGFFFNFIESDPLGREATHYDFSRYLNYVDSIIRNCMVISRYRSEIYPTLKQALHAFYQVMLISGRNDIPQFYYKEGAFKRIVKDSEKKYDNYVTAKLNRQIIGTDIVE